ncbi:hypothetical protein CBR_g15963 [Chara braunii]|uniref:Uncharacterized protein n=1 Tax=Chara braunii TaxID=69332 RepID=A0A388JSS6_CHABU|nr:hypothetical protein CBR_g15963 [Chara braunii]|eukprot:GBG60840.1 hypothetical protein CBR_g15963 [Chara braunii]
MSGSTTSQSVGLQISQQQAMSDEDYEIAKANTLHAELQRQLQEVEEKRDKARIRKARLGARMQELGKLEAIDESTLDFVARSLQNSLVLTTYLRCLTTNVKNKLVNEASMDVHNFASFSQKAVDIEAKLGSAQQGPIDGRKKKKLPQDWRKKGNLMFVDHDGQANGIDDFSGLREEKEVDWSGETSDGGVAAPSREKAKGAGKQKVSQPKGQNDQRSPIWVKLGLDYEVWRDRVARDLDSLRGYLAENLASDDSKLQLTGVQVAADGDGGALNETKVTRRVLRDGRQMAMVMKKAVKVEIRNLSVAPTEEVLFKQQTLYWFDVSAHVHDNTYAYCVSCAFDYLMYDAHGRQEHCTDLRPEKVWCDRWCPLRAHCHEWYAYQMKSVNALEGHTAIKTTPMKNLPYVVTFRQAFVTRHGHIYNDEVGFDPRWRCPRASFPAIRPERAWRKFSYKKVLAIDHVWRGPYHEIIDVLAPMTAIYEELLADPSIMIHTTVDALEENFEEFPDIRHRASRSLEEMMETSECPDRKEDSQEGSSSRPDRMDRVARHPREGNLRQSNQGGDCTMLNTPSEEDTSAATPATTPSAVPAGGPTLLTPSVEPRFPTPLTTSASLSGISSNSAQGGLVGLIPGIPFTSGGQQIPGGVLRPSAMSRGMDSQAPAARVPSTTIPSHSMGGSGSGKGQNGRQRLSPPRQLGRGRASAMLEKRSAEQAASASSSSAALVSLSSRGRGNVGGRGGGGGNRRKGKSNLNIYNPTSPISPGLGVTSIQGDKKDKVLDTWLRTVPVWVRAKRTLVEEEVIIVASYLEGSAARWLNGLVASKGFGRNMGDWAKTHTLESFMDLVEAQIAIDGLLKLDARKYKFVCELTTTVERLTVVPGVEYNPQVLLTMFFRCLPADIKNLSASEDRLEYHTFETFSKKALDLEATLVGAQTPPTDGRKKKAPQEWKKKGSRLMMVDSDGNEMEIDDVSDFVESSGRWLRQGRSTKELGASRQPKQNSCLG